jgi:hypothetical protein
MPTLELAPRETVAVLKGRDRRGGRRRHGNVFAIKTKAQ